MTLMDQNFTIFTNNRYLNYDVMNKDGVFEVDDLIAPIIRELNKKNYETEFSCSCHPFESKNIAAEEITEEYTIRNMIDDAPEDHNCALLTGSCIGTCGDIKYGVISFVSGPTSAYIQFRHVYEFNESELPKGWHIEGLNHPDGEARTIIRKKYMDDYIVLDVGDYYYEFISLFLKDMKELYKWAKSLKENDKK